MPDDRPKFQHDTRRIIAVNAAACELFGCEEIALVDLDMLELVHDDRNRRWLASIRLQTMRREKMPEPFVHLFRRLNGSLFFGAVTTQPLPDKTFETSIVYLKEKD